MDISLIGTGSIEAVFEIGLDNGINMTDAIPNGTEIEINQEPVDSIVHRYYQTKKVKPATGRQVVYNALLQENSAMLLDESGNIILN